VEAGQGIRDTGLKREQLWITTKWSGVDDKPVRQSCLESLEKVCVHVVVDGDLADGLQLGVEYLDLYLIHSPRLCKGDIAGTWAQFELLKKEGLVK
jgi:diketogulonate reductase-like aldo/keto reductase